MASSAGAEAAPPSEEAAATADAERLAYPLFRRPSGTLMSGDVGEMHSAPPAAAGADMAAAFAASNAAAAAGFAPLPGQQVARVTVV